MASSRLTRQLRRGDVLGRFTVLRRLSQGGNADVYEVMDAEVRIALKVLRNRNGMSEPYRRFRQEVAKHHELSDMGFAGVLPLIDFDVPAAPSDARPPWMAMPLATPMQDALGDSALLDAVVEAMGEIADTLARLHAQNVAHRDIKPSNLYRYQNSWVISDFGLVEIPHGDPLTIGAKALGPRHFIAPEMTLQANGADGRGADVYSLGKCLWCLATGQATPPPGEHRKELQWKSLATWGVTHPRAFYLDQLIRQTSAEVPAERPSMAMVARTLREWIRKPIQAAGANDLDVDDLTAGVADVLDADRRRSDQDARRRGDVEDVVNRMASGIAGFVGGLTAANLVNAGLTSAHEGLSGSLEGFADDLPGVDRVAAWRSVRVERNTGRDQRHAFLRSGVAAALATDQTVALAAAHTITHAGGLETVWKAECRSVLLGSSELDTETARITAGFMDQVPTVLARYLAIIRPER